MKWKFEKFIGNPIVYALCPKCGTYHEPTKMVMNPYVNEMEMHYTSCLSCGTHLEHDEDINVAWNKRVLDEHICIQKLA